jgi:hypothetical protein
VCWGVLLAAQRMPVRSLVCLYAYAPCSVAPCCVCIHFTLTEHRNPQTRPMQRLERHLRTLRCRTCVFTYKSRAYVGSWPWGALGEPRAGNAKKRWFRMRQSGLQATACWCWAPGLAPSPAGPHGRMQGQYVGVVGLQQRCGVVLGQGSVLAAVLPFVSRAPGGPPAGVPSSAVHHQ